VSKTRPWQVWLVDFDPALGAEMRGRRPAIVIASALHCGFPIPMTLVVPVTTSDRGLPHHIPITSAESGLDRKSWAKTEEITSISERRLTSVRALGVLAGSERDAIRAELRLMIDL
jgi:mRNA interferase MazF